MRLNPVVRGQKIGRISTIERPSVNVVILLFILARLLIRDGFAINVIGW